MAPETKTVTTTRAIIIQPDNERTALLFANMDTTVTIYIGDEGLSSSNGFPIFPESYVLLSFDEGIEVYKAFYAIVASGTADLRVWEHFGSVKVLPSRPNNGPTPDPPMS